jgi:glycine cleavage system H lipoate-binding protein
MVSEDPQGNGWFFKMSVSDWADYDALMDEDEYLASIG